MDASERPTRFGRGGGMPYSQAMVLAMMLVSGVASVSASSETTSTRHLLDDVVPMSPTILTFYHLTQHFNPRKLQQNKAPVFPYWRCADYSLTKGSPYELNVSALMVGDLLQITAHVIPHE
eukprot:gene11187-18802_t